MGIQNFPEGIQDEARAALDYLFEVLCALLFPRSAQLELINHPFSI